MDKANIINKILEDYKKKGKVTLLMNDMTYHAEEDLDLEELCFDVANKISEEARQGMIKIEDVNKTIDRIEEYTEKVSPNVQY